MIKMNGKVIVDKDSDNLRGKIISQCILSGRIKNDGQLVGGKASISTDHETYIGDYTVTPKVEQQSLNTIDKLMTDDVIIKAIPYYKVSNIYNGETIIIGENI